MNQAFTTIALQLFCVCDNIEQLLSYNVLFAVLKKRSEYCILSELYFWCLTDGASK